MAKDINTEIYEDEETGISFKSTEDLPGMGEWMLRYAELDDFTGWLRLLPEICDKDGVKKFKKLTARQIREVYLRYVEWRSASTQALAKELGYGDEDA